MRGKSVLIADRLRFRFVMGEVVVGLDLIAERNHGSSTSPHESVSEYFIGYKATD